MCRKVLLYILNNKKLNWLERKKPNPYAFVWDKLDYLFFLIALSSFGLLFFAGNKMPCPAFLFEVFFIIGFLSIVRQIKSVPADINQAFSKPLICYSLIIISVLMIFGLIKVLNCL